MNLHESIEIFLKNQSKRLADKSIVCYASILKNLEAHIGGLTDFCDVKETDLDDFQIGLKGVVGINTQVNYANVLRAFFKFWARRGVTPLIYEAIQGPRKEETRPNFITPQQFEQIDQCFQETDFAQLTQKLAFNLLWDTGMRIGELMALNISDFATDRCYVTITTEKSRKLRILAWSDATHQILIKYLGVRLCLNQSPALFLSAGPAGKGSRNGRLTARTVQRWCKNLGNELGFNINPHAFRHGKMHAIINAGGNRQHVQTIAGHASIQSSEVYVRLNEAEQLRIQTQFLQGREKIPVKQQSPYSHTLLAE